VLLNWTGRGYIRVNGPIGDEVRQDVWAVGGMRWQPHNSRTYPKTIFESYVTISQAEIAAPAIGWFHIPCSLIRRFARVGLSEGESGTPRLSSFG